MRNRTILAAMAIGAAFCASIPAQADTLYYTPNGGVIIVPRNRDPMTPPARYYLPPSNGYFVPPPPSRFAPPGFGPPPGFHHHRTWRDNHRQPPWGAPHHKDIRKNR